MKLFTHKPNTYLLLTGAAFFFTLKSTEVITVISVNNINSLLVKIESIALSVLQKSVGFLFSTYKTPYISKKIQRFILVGWIDRP